MILMASIFLMEKCNRVKCALTQYSMLKKRVGYSENTGRDFTPKRVAFLFLKVDNLKVYQSSIQIDI